MTTDNVPSGPAPSRNLHVQHERGFCVCRLQIQPGEQPLPLHPRGLPVLLPAQAPNDIPCQEAHEKDAGEEL